MARCILCAEETRLSVKTLRASPARDAKLTHLAAHTRKTIRTPLLLGSPPTHPSFFTQFVTFGSPAPYLLNPVAARVPGHLYGLGKEDDENLGTPTAGQQYGYRILARQLCARGGTETPRAVTRFRGDHDSSRKRGPGRE